MTSSHTKSTQQSTSADSDFVLKHRIAGAAFLLFFGALILPYLLGAPADGNQPPVQSKATINSGEGEPSHQSAEEILLAAIESEDNRPEEQVYISKITPLDIENASDAPDAAVSVAAPRDSLDDQELAMLEQLDRQQNELIKPIIPTTQKPSSSNDTDSPTSAAPQATSVTSSDGEPDTGSSATATKKAIDVGWVVQVGVFTDKSGAARVVQDLESKGFAPSTTIVDTNRGKATGTRIWLGPYEQRVEAAKAKALLTSKTGEAGFIRAYP